MTAIDACKLPYSALINFLFFKAPPPQKKASQSFKGAMRSVALLYTNSHTDGERKWMNKLYDGGRRERELELKNFIFQGL